ncbi:SIMPL domain-containing protein [Pseudobacteriovorax antillogorgiicola]|uniref:DUF541 domain-containing protein n=1 Tax=Pseudobacteriovorax antillogorgiicola TaxID=1513793 RepID=A0A1Y6BB00_9BACT|nr:SIMPL domain-containing protein [Pseudobacteriovorax antillogorgiicola]TCS57456.1 hypothetical protein EDD56_103196 [Pseudobacteriovorax antillogorgiicola]SMF00839.1 hypothetical protein SAMN06296036_103137 [Pseudobacteriovorax antillogorgiicola]
MLKHSVLLLVILLSSQTFGAVSEIESKVLQVSGHGKVSLPASIAQISVAISILDKNAAKVQGELRTKTNRLTKALKGDKVEKLSTDQYQIQTRSRYQGGKKQDLGFEGLAILSFEVPVDRAGEMLDRVIKHGANEIRHIRFTATEQELSHARNKALAMGAQKALKEGQQILGSLGLDYQEIAQVIVGPQGGGPRDMSRLQFARSSADESVAIEAGDVDVGAQVMLILKYK